MSKNKKAIVIEGVKFTKENFPILYEWAENRPERLAEMLRKNAEVHGGAPTAAANALESDLQHDFNYKPE